MQRSISLVPKDTSSEKEKIIVLSELEKPAKSKEIPLTLPGKLNFEF